MKKSTKAKASAVKNMLAKALAARAVMGAGAGAPPMPPPGPPPGAGGPPGMKKGGSFRTAANGIAKRGKTKGKIVKMACGGK